MHKRHSFFSLVPFIMLAADLGGHTGNEAPQTLEEKFTAASARVTELEGQVSNIAALTSERDSLQTENTRLQSQFEELTNTSNGLRDEVQNLTTQLGTVTSERDNAVRERNNANVNITRLESLCGVKGIDPQSAAPNLGEAPGPEAQPKSKQDQLRHAMEENNKISDPAARAEHHNKHIAPLLSRS